MLLLNFGILIIYFLIFLFKSFLFHFICPSQFLHLSTLNLLSIPWKSKAFHWLLIKSCISSWSSTKIPLPYIEPEKGIPLEEKDSKKSVHGLGINPGPTAGGPTGCIIIYFKILIFISKLLSCVLLSFGYLFYDKYWLFFPWTIS